MMLNRLQLITILSAIWFLSASCGKKTSPPDILLIMADDMGYSDIGCYGGEINTPSIDALASEGVRFTQFYNSARCCPTRAALLTGLYPHQAGLGHMVDGIVRGGGYFGELNNNCVTIAEVLGSNGYSTYMSGKWHVSRSVSTDDIHNWPLQRGFERFYGTITGAGSYYDPATLTYMNDPISAKPGFYYTDAIADSAMAFIESHISRKKDKPYFMYMAFTAPHWPLHAPEDVISRYEELYSKGWDILRDERMDRQKQSGIIGNDIILSDRDSSVPVWEDVTEKDWQARRMATYAAQVEIMDMNIGRILNLLEKNGRLENTIVIFLSDNGGCAEGWNSSTEWVRRYAPAVNYSGDSLRFDNTPDVWPGADDTYASYSTEWANLSNTPFRMYKHYTHEGGIATPFIVRWPGKIKKGGELRQQVAGIIDIMATLVEVTGAEYPGTYNGNEIIRPAGISLVDAILNNGETGRESYYFEHEWNRAVRTGDWKLVSLWNGEWELYNMATDRTEMNDLSPDYPLKVKEMADDWEQWAWRTGVLPRTE